MNAITTATTAAEARNLAGQAGLTGSALELAVKAGARNRHEWRTRQTLAAAFHYAIGGGRGSEPGNDLAFQMADEVIGRESGSEMTSALEMYRAEALAVLLYDLNGVNGPWGAGFEQGSTGRLCWTHQAQTGTGRWQAGDGDAWRAAGASAVFHLTQTMGGSSLYYAIEIGISADPEDREEPTMVEIRGLMVALTSPDVRAYEHAFTRRIVLELVRGETSFELQGGIHIQLDPKHLALWGERLNWLDKMLNQ